MSFEEEGYFSPDIKNTTDEAIRNYGDFIDLYFQANRNLLLIRYSTEVDSEDAKQLIVTALSIKANDSIQAAVNLLLLGLESDAKALIRVALEAIIILKTVCVDDQYIEKFLSTEKAVILKFMNAIAGDQNKEYPDVVKKSVDPEQLSKLYDEVKSNNIQEVNVLEYAQKSKLTYLYDYIYRIHSNDIHTNPKTVMKYLKVQDNDINGIDPCPRIDELPRSMVAIFCLLREMTECICDLFSIDKTSSIALFDKIHNFITMYTDRHGRNY